MKEEMAKKAEETKQAEKAFDEATGEISDDNLDSVAGGVGNGNQQIFAQKQQRI